jgi:hypothetical protein
MEDKLFTLLGLGVPFYLAAATYAVFSWLDNNASDEATKVISSWLHGRSHNKPDLGNLIIGAFDRIYTSPLLTFRAFRRSAAISTVIWSAVFLVPWIISNLPIVVGVYGVLILDFIANLVTIALTDYVSLLFVRLFLGAAQKRPIGATLLSSVVGFAVVLVGIFIFGIAFVFVMYQMRNIGVIEIIGRPLQSYKEVITSIFQGAWDASKDVFDFDQPFLARGMAPAFIIHLWLPLFGLSSLVVRLVYLILTAVEWAQWFLKRGDAHPLKAIGVVATIIVFGSAMLVKEGWALLSVLERS